MRDNNPYLKVYRQVNSPESVNCTLFMGNLTHLEGRLTPRMDRWNTLQDRHPTPPQMFSTYIQGCMAHVKGR